MNDMWTTLERYQPFADKRGFGAEWLKMTTERTPDAAYAASYAAYAAVNAVNAVWAAAWAAVEASGRAAEAEAEAAARYAARAIQHINKAIKSKGRLCS